MTLLQLATSKEAISVYALALAALEKKFQFIKPVVQWGKAHEGALKTLEKDVENVASDVFHSPTLAAMKLENAHLKSQMEQSDIYKVATAVLHNVGVKVEQMTPDMKNSVAVAVTNEVHALYGKIVTAHQVLGVLDEFQTLATKVSASPSVTAVDQLTQATAQTVAAQAQDQTPTATTPSA